MSLLWTAAVVIFFVVTRAQQQHRCYVCVSGRNNLEVAQLFPHDTLVHCQTSSQIKICPEGFKGCLTEIKGSEVTRTCAQLGVESCRSVNGVEYCYCRGELCNVPELQSADVDDEDMTEGSGVLVGTTTSSEVPTVSSQHNSTTMSTSSRSAPSSLLTMAAVLVWKCR